MSTQTTQTTQATQTKPIETFNLECLKSSGKAVGVKADPNVYRFSILDETRILRFDWDTWSLYELEFEVTDDALDKSRLQEGGSSSVILFTDDHNPNKRIGKVLNLDIADRTLFADVRVGTSEWGLRYLQEVVDDVEPGKSVEVTILDYDVIQKAEYDGEGWDRKKIKNEIRRATRWQITGLSTVTTPAIGSVGFSMDEVQRFELKLSQMQNPANTKIETVKEVLTMSSEQKEIVDPTDQNATNQRDEIIALQARLTALEAENAVVKQNANELLTDLTNHRLELRMSRIHQFLSQHSTRITPAMLSHTGKLGDQNSASLESFIQSLNDAQGDWLMGWLGALPETVPTAGRIQSFQAVGNAPEAPKPVNPVQLAKLASAYVQEQRALGIVISNSEALDHILATHGVA